MADEALDNLGRKVDTTNMSIGELKGLIASLMKSKVGAAKPVNEKKDDPAKKLTTLFEKYTKDFEKETKEQKGLLQKIVDGFKEMKSKKSGGRASDEKASFSEKANKSLGKGLKASKEDQTTAKSTKSLENIFGKKGSGYTHDVYCERFLKEIYGVLVEMARQKGITRATPESVEKEIKEKEVATPPTERRSRGGESEGERESEIEQLLHLEEIDAGRITNFREAWNWTRALVTGNDDLLETAKAEEIIRYSSIETLEEKLEVTRKEAREAKESLKFQDRARKASKDFLDDLNKTIKSFEDLFFGFSVFEKVFKGIVREEIKFTQEVRQAAYETAGVTKESKALQRTYEDIGKTVKLTGFDRSDFQKEYLRNLRSGVKDQKKAMTLTTTQLNTEKQIGVEAGSLGDTFVMLNNQLKLSDDQISEVGRGIREAGRNTGLVGSELAGVVNSSKQFVDQMRKAGIATASSISNVIALQAEFKKLGVEDAGGKILSAISSTTGFYEAGIQTQSLIANAASRVGLAFDMTTGGIVKSNEKLKLLNKGLIKTANSLGLGGSNLEEMRKNFENMSDEAKRTINLRFKGAFGMEAGEVLGTIEAFENKTKTLSEKLSDLNKEKSKNLTLEERATLAEKERSLKLSAGLKALTALSEAAKDVTNMDQALAKFGKRRSEFEGDIKALGGSWTSETDAARTAIESSVNELNKGLKGAGKKGLSIDSARIEKALRDPAALRELTAEISKGEQELATAQKAQTDPLTSMDQTLKEINDGIRGMSQGIISGIFNSPLGKALIVLVAILGFVGASLLKLNGAFVGVTNFLKGMQTWFSSSKEAGSEGALAKVKDSIFRRFKKVEKEPEYPADSKDVAASATEKASENIKEASKQTTKANESILEVLKQIRDCICGKTTAVSETTEKKAVSVPESKEAQAARKGYREATQLKGVSAAEKEAAGRASWEKMKAEGLDPRVERAQRKNDQKQQKNTLREEKIQKQQQKNVKQETRNIKQQTNLVKQEVAAPEVEGLSESGFDINKLIKSGKEMGKAALAVTILGLGAVALGSAIVFVAKGILSAFNLDMKTIIEVAGAVAALAAAGGAIVAAGYVAYEALMEDKEAQEGEKIAKELNTKLLKQLGIAILLGPTLVLLGSAIVKTAQLITQAFGLDMGTAVETAGAVVAIVGAAGALIGGAATALENLDKLKENKTFQKLFSGGAGELAMDLGKAAIFLIGISTALVLLASAVVKMAQLITGVLGLDMGTAAKIAGDVAALIGAAGLIVGAVLGAAVGLKALGYFAKKGLGAKSKIIMMKGATALAALVLPITLLAVSLNLLLRGILGALGIDAGVAAKAAWDIGVLISATGAIAFAVLAATTGLMALGGVVGALTGPQLLFAAVLMGLGAIALLALAPTVSALASALIFFVKGTLSVLGMDASKAAEISNQVGSILGSAATIVMSVLASMAGLAILGASIPLLGVATIFMFLGAAALRYLTPAVVGLAASIITMAEKTMEKLIDPKNAEEVVKALNSVLGAASSIAWSIIKMSSGLALLGNMIGAIFLAIPFMYLGAAAIKALTGPVSYFVNIIKDFYESISFIDPKDAVKMGEESAAIFNSVGQVANHILKTRDSLLSLVGANNWGWLGSANVGMMQGANAIRTLMLPVLLFVLSIENFYRLLSIILSPEEASKMGKGIASILCAVGTVVNGILMVKQNLIALKGAAGGFLSWLAGKDPVTLMYQGSAALEKLKEPVKEFIGKTLEFYKNLTSGEDGVNPEEASKVGNGIANILNAVGNIVRGILWAKEGMIGLKGVAGGIFSGNPISSMKQGSAALEKLKEPVKEFIGKTLKFYKNLTSGEDGVNPEKAKEAANGVGMVLGAVGFITSKLVAAQEALVALSKGGLRNPNKIVSQMYAGTEALNQIMWPVISYATTIKLFSDILRSTFGSTEELVASANGVANVLRAVGFITWHILASAKMLASIKANKLATALSSSLKIINEGIISPIKDNLGDTSALEEMSYQLDLILEIADKMYDIGQICKGLNPVQLGGSMEGKLSGVMGGTTSDKSISQRNEAKQADSLHDSSRVLAEFVETSLRGKGIIVRTNGETAAVNSVPISGGISSAESMQERVKRERASSASKKSEVTSPELSEIVDKTEEQNIILSKMEKLLEKFVELAKPQSEISSGGGGSQEPPTNNSVVGKPTNYYRRVIGNFNNTPSRSIVNVGAKAIS